MWAVVVEDDFSIGRLIEMWLQDLGYKTRVFDTFMDAYRHLVTNRKEYSLFVLDYKLDNGFTGANLADTLDLKDYGHVLFMTAYGKETAELNIFPKYTNYDILHKPLDIDLFYNTVRSFRNKQAERA